MASKTEKYQKVRIITSPVNARENWDATFQEAFELGDDPESDYFADMKNEFNKTEWTW